MQTYYKLGSLHVTAIETHRRVFSLGVFATLRAPSPPPAPALPMRAPAPCCQRGEGGGEMRACPRRASVMSVQSERGWSEMRSYYALRSEMGAHEFTNHDAALTSPPCPRPAGGPCARRPIRRRRPCRCARPRRAVSDARTSSVITKPQGLRGSECVYGLSDHQATRAA